LLLQRELEFQRGYDLLYDLILQGKDVLEWAVVALSPELFSCSGINQLGRHSHLIVSFAHTAFQDVAYPHFPTHVLHLHRFALVGKRRIAGDDEQAGEEEGMKIGADCKRLRVLGRRLLEDPSLVWDRKDETLSFFRGALGNSYGSAVTFGVGEYQNHVH
jgi:hypothetical protein